MGVCPHFRTTLANRQRQLRTTITSGACSSRALNLTLFLFLGIVSFEPIGRPCFNCGLGLLAMLYFNFSIGISIRAKIFVAGICDFVTFVE